MAELKKSIFMEKLVQPTPGDVEKTNPAGFHLWKELMDFIVANYPSIAEEWSHSGKNYGWSFRLRSKKRVVMYFTPLDNSFRVAFALGQAATDALLINPTIPPELKKELLEAPVYMEGRGLRIEITSVEQLPIVKEIIKLKMEN
jgi:hypothetical protein